MSSGDTRPPPTPTRTSGSFSALRHRDFRVLWLGMVFSGSTFVFQYYALAWFVVQTTDSPIALGILGGGRGILMIILSVYGGALADRMDRRKLLFVTQGATMAIVAVLAAVLLMGVTDLRLIFVLIFTSSAVHAIDAPVRQALTPQLVPREDIPNAMALVMAAQMGAFAYLPPLAGLAIDHLGPGGAIAISLVGHASILIALAMLRYRGTPGAGQQRRPTIWNEIGQGVSYVAGQPTVFWVLAVTWVTAGLGMPLITVLAPLWMKNTLGLGATGYTTISAFWGTATLVTSLFLATHRGLAGRRGLFMVSALVFGASVVLFAFTRYLPLIALAWAINGLSYSANSVAGTSIVQITVPDTIRGRVTSLLMLSRSLSQIAAIPLSIFAQFAGMETAVPVTALLCIAVLATMAAAVPNLRRMSARVDPPNPESGATR